MDSKLAINYMNLGNKSLEAKIEQAITFLAKTVPTGQDRKKPLLLHAIRVGTYLYQNNYSEDAVLGGFLHDSLEWTDASEERIKHDFGEKILDIVKANTKDRSIDSVHERRSDYVARCAAVGEDALIVKAADTLDSFYFYTATKNQDEIDRCKDIVQLLLEQELPDVIAKKLKAIK